MTPTGRIVGVDVARCLALLGMMATHILPTFDDQGRLTTAHLLAGGRASALFAVLAGVSLVLVAGRTPLRGRRWWGMLAGTVVRAVLIGAVGLLLGEVESGIAVILAFYAVLFVVAVPFLALGTRAVAAVAVVWVLAAPVVSHLWRRRLPGTTYEVPSLESLEEPAALLRDLVVTGYYPVLTWVPYVLLGVVLGRVDLRSPAVAVRVAAGGAAAMVAAWLVSDALLRRPGVRPALVASFDGAGWAGDLDRTLASGLYGVTPTGSPWWLAVRAPHTGATPDLVLTAGHACLVLGVCLLVGRLAPRVLAVVFGAGAMTLTLYTLHVALRADGWWDADDGATYLGQAGLVLAVGAAFRLARRRGPLEAVVGEVSSAARRAVGGRG